MSANATESKELSPVLYATDANELARMIAVHLESILPAAVAAAVREALDEQVSERYLGLEHLSRQETAAALKVSVDTLAAWEKKGILVPMRVGRRVLYDRDAVDAALRRRR